MKIVTKNETLIQYEQFFTKNVILFVHLKILYRIEIILIQEIAKISFLAICKISMPDYFITNRMEHHNLKMGGWRGIYLRIYAIL